MAIEQHVIAEQVPMQYRLGQYRSLLTQPVQYRQHGMQRGAGPRLAALKQRPGLGGHPRQSPIAWAQQTAGRRGIMQSRQRLADRLAMAGIRGIDMPPRQPWLQQCRSIIETMQGDSAAVAQGIGHRQASLLQAVEQLDEKRQFGDRATFDQGQHVFAPLGGDEEVAVLGAAGDAAVIDQPAELEALQKVFQFRSLDRSEYRHVSALPLEDLP